MIWIRSAKGRILFVLERAKTVVLCWSTSWIEVFILQFVGKWQMDGNESETEAHYYLSTIWTMEWQGPAPYSCFNSFNVTNSTSSFDVTGLNVVIQRYKGLLPLAYLRQSLHLDCLANDHPRFRPLERIHDTYITVTEGLIDWTLEVRIVILFLISLRQRESNQSHHPLLCSEYHGSFRSDVIEDGHLQVSPRCVKIVIYPACHFEKIGYE